MIQANCFRYTDNESKYQMLHWLAGKAVSRKSSFNQLDNAYNLEIFIGFSAAYRGPEGHAGQNCAHAVHNISRSYFYTLFYLQKSNCSILFRWN